MIENGIVLMFCLNPLIGHIANKYPMFGTRIKYALIFTGVLTSMGYFICVNVSAFKIPFWAMIIVHFFINFTNSFRSVLVDSLSVIYHNTEKLTKNSTGSSAKTVCLTFGFHLSAKILSLLTFTLLYKFMKLNCQFNRFLSFLWNVSFKLIGRVFND